MRQLAAIALVLILTLALLGNLGRPGAPTPQTPIFQGVRFQADRLEPDRTGWGAAQIAEIDLGETGVEVVLSGREVELAPQGFSYHRRLTFPREIAGEARLAVAVNGVHFSSRSLKVCLPGDLANAENAIAADGQIECDEPYSFLLWQDAEFRLHVEPQRGAEPAVLARARWAVGGYDLVLWQGKPTLRGDQIVDAQTIAGIDASGRRLWLAVFDHASGGRAAGRLASLGAAAAIRLDGGASSCMYLGERAKTIRSGYRQRPWRPSAVWIGVRATPLE